MFMNLLIFSNVPTFATCRLQEILVAKGGTKWARNGRWGLSENARLSRNIQGSFTCRKSTTWDRRLCFPSEGRCAEDFFFALKNPTASVGFEPANFGTKGQHTTSRPPKPLGLCLLFGYLVVMFNCLYAIYVYMYVCTCMSKLQPFFSFRNPFSVIF